MYVGTKKGKLQKEILFLLATKSSGKKVHTTIDSSYMAKADDGCPSLKCSSKADGSFFFFGQKAATDADAAARKGREEPGRNFRFKFGIHPNSA